MYADILYLSHFSNKLALQRHFRDLRIYLSNDTDIECQVYKSEEQRITASKCNF